MKRSEFPRIRLAPWEHQPDAPPEVIEAPAQNVVPFEWGGQTLQVAARLVDCGDGVRYLFARFVGEADESNWVLGFGSVDDGPRSISGDQRLKLAKRLKGYETSRYFPFGRLFYFGDDELRTAPPSRAFIASDGSGCWLPLSPDDEPHPFRLPLQPGELLRHVPACDIWARLLDKLKDADSDVCFAFEWRNRSEAERENLLLKVERGSIDEFRHLLTCALCIETVVKKQDGNWEWFMEGEISSLNCWPSGDAFPKWVDLPIRLRVWERIAFEYFSPSPRHSLLHRHSCARRWFNNRPSFLHLAIQTPTQHERLEAALWLRDWAQDKVAPRKLRLLLGGV
ncbi:hypothetical protein IAD21_02392 [Abditibacteriota bacterium]|nr:hypothetical protein IAD21_02392 [Abditibacteriota bacterium]